MNKTEMLRKMNILSFFFFIALYVYYAKSADTYSFLNLNGVNLLMAFISAIQFFALKNKRSS